MAEIYTRNGDEITVGLQSSAVCDEAMHAAKDVAHDRGQEVYLEDDEERYTVYPNGHVEDGWDGEWQSYGPPH